MLLHEVRNREIIIDVVTIFLQEEMEKQPAGASVAMVIWVDAHEVEHEGGGEDEFIDLVILGGFVELIDEVIEKRDYFLWGRGDEDRAERAVWHRFLDVVLAIFEASAELGVIILVNIIMEGGYEAAVEGLVFVDLANQIEGVKVTDHHMLLQGLGMARPLGKGAFPIFCNIDVADGVGANRVGAIGHRHEIIDFFDLGDASGLSLVEFDAIQQGNDVGGI